MTKFKGLRIDVLCLIAVLISQAILICQEFGRYLPITDGWYVGLTKATKSAVLYKDVYFPFPPGTYFFEGYLPSLFKNPMFGEQVIHSISWMLLSVSFYLILRYSFPNFIAAVVSITALSIYFTQPGNIISGYFELMYLFFFVGTALLLWSAEGEKRLQHVLLFAAGTCLALSVTVKQSALLPVLLVIFSYLKSNWKSRREVAQFNTVLIFGGLCLPSTVVLTWAYQNHTLFEMFNSMLGGGKDVGGLSIVTTFGANVLPNIQMSSAVFLSALFVVIQLQPKHKKFWILEIVIIWFAFMQFSGFGLFDRWSQSPILGYLLILSLVSIMKIVLQRNSEIASVELEKSANSNSLLLTTLFLSLSAFIGIGVTQIDTASGSLSPNLQTWLTGFSASVSSNLVICGTVSVVGLYVASKFGVTLFLKETEQVRMRRLSKLVLLSTITFYLMNSFAGGIGVEVFAINIALVLGMILYFVQSRHGNYVLISLIMAFFVPWTVAASVFHVSQPYSWYGITEMPLNTPRKTPKAPGLSSFSLSVKSANDYDLIYDGVFAGMQIVNKGRSPVLLGPRNSGLAAMFDLDTYPLQCQILWWDMCPEKIALEDYQRIRNSPPELIIWTFEAEDTITSNQNGWRRESNSAVGLIQAWLSERIGKGYYRVLAETGKQPDLSDSKQPITRVLVHNPDEKSKYELFNF